MTLLSAFVLSALALVPPQGGKAALSAADARSLRTAFAAALAKNDAPSRAALVALGKKLGAKHDHAALRDALREGPWLDDKALAPRKHGKEREEFSKFGTTTVGYVFESPVGEFRYAVDVPEGHDAAKPAAVLLDPGHGTGLGKSDEEKAGFLPFYRGQCRAAGLEDWLIVRTEVLEQVGADGKRGALPEDEAARAFEALWRDLGSRYAIDPDRLYVSGLSQTGFWSWYLGRARPDRYAGIAPMSAVTWQVAKYLPNFGALPVFVLHGAADKVCPVAQPRATCAELEKLGFQVKYVEVEGAGHDVSTWSRLNQGLAWLAERPRAKYAKSRELALQTLATPWCGALRIDELERTGDGRAGSAPTATASVKFEGQRVVLTTQGVKRATLCLAAELVDLGRAVEVEWNGKGVWQGVPQRSFATLLELALDRADWKETFDAALELRAP